MSDNAVAVIEQSPDAVVEWNLDGWPEDRYLRLVPTQTLGLVNDFVRPLIVTVLLDIETDTYESRDIKQGHRAPNAKGLSKLADAAGVNFVDEARLDDGSDPNRAYVRVYAEMIDGTGLRRRAPGSRDYVLASQTMTDAQRQRAKGYVHEHAATRARHRALRALLSLPQSYAIADLKKPFAIARFVLNTQHPEIREAVKAALVGAVAAVYGPASTQQLEAGTVMVDEVPDDEPIDVTPAAPATPTVLPGEKLAAAASGAEPDWITGASTVKAEPGLIDKLRDLLDAASLKGPITQAQKDRLGPLFSPLSGTGEFGAVIAAAFGEAFIKAPTAAQAEAIITVANSVDADEDFLAAWRAAAAVVREAA